MRVAGRLSVIVMAVGLMSSACGNVPLAASDISTQAKVRTPGPQKALIYLYRNEWMGGNAKMEVSLDGRIAGKTQTKTFFVWEVDPGRHEIESEAENTDKLVLNVEAAKTYFVWQEVKSGIWFPRTRLHLVDDAKGRAGVEECKMIQGKF